jgi:hypothetical protein
MLFLPLLVSVGAWLQKKEEAEMEDHLEMLERARYRMMGA